MAHGLRAGRFQRRSVVRLYYAPPTVIVPARSHLAGLIAGADRPLSRPIAFETVRERVWRNGVRLRSTANRRGDSQAMNNRTFQQTWGPAAASTGFVSLAHAGRIIAQLAGDSRQHSFPLDVHSLSALPHIIGCARFPDVRDVRRLHILPFGLASSVPPTLEATRPAGAPRHFLGA